MAQHGVVVSVHPLATAAGVEVLQNGGNAFDAAAAVGLTLGVVDGHNSGIGGGCFMLIRKADGSFLALDGREKAPAAATRDMFVREGKVDPKLSREGPRAIGVPGSLAVYEKVVRELGKKPLADRLETAAKLAEAGFEVDAHYLQRVRSEEAGLRAYAVDAPFFRREGNLLRQPELADSYRAIAKLGIAWFYGGDFAKKLETWMKKHDGLLSAQDFADYRVVAREPVRTDYRGFEVVSFPPPSSGGVHVVEILNMLEKFDLAVLAEPSRIHVMAEAMKLAFADRAKFLGDPDFVKVPRGLLDKSYARNLADRIRMNSTIEVPGAGHPSFEEIFKHTTHFSIADGEGNWLSCTTTLNTPFGSKVMIPGTGIVLNNQMDDFAAQPGIPNAYGLVGGEANAIAPGKRPLSSMSPTIVLRDGQPRWALGAAGGPKIITQVILNLVGLIDLDWSMEKALAQPRFHHQWKPDVLMIEKKMSAATREALRQLGHPLEIMEYSGVSVVAAQSEAGFSGAADPRVNGKVTAF